eukprot:COSAG05_NODE_105_length_18793_cov_115.346421_23_plen_510_part_00
MRSGMAQVLATVDELLPHGAEGRELLHAILSSSEVVPDPASALQTLLVEDTVWTARPPPEAATIIDAARLLLSRGAPGGAALYQGCKGRVVWPLLSREGGSNGERELLLQAARCLHTLAVPVGEVASLRQACAAAVACIGQGRACELSAAGAVTLATVLCSGGGEGGPGVWQDPAFSLGLLEGLLELLRAESISDQGLDRTTTANIAATDEPAQLEVSQQESLLGDGGSLALGHLAQSPALQLGLEQLLPMLLQDVPTECQGDVASQLCGAVRRLLMDSVHGVKAQQLECRALALALGSRFHPFLFGAATTDATDLRGDVAGFWEPLRHALADERKMIRHVALLLLQQAVGCSLGSEDTATAPHAPAIGDTTTGDNDWEAVQKAWRVYIMLFETLEQPESHLLGGVWPELQVFCAQAGCLRGGPCQARHPSLRAAGWLGVLLNLGLMMNDNHAVQKLVLESTLRGELYAASTAKFGHGQCIDEATIFASTDSAHYTSGSRFWDVSGILN